MFELGSVIETTQAVNHANIIEVKMALDIFMASYGIRYLSASCVLNLVIISTQNPKVRDFRLCGVTLEINIFMQLTARFLVKNSIL